MYTLYKESKTTGCVYEDDSDTRTTIETGIKTGAIKLLDLNGVRA